VKIEVDNILHIVDICAHSLSEKTIEYLEESQVDWRDQVMKEHIINVGNAVEEIDDDEDQFMQNTGLDHNNIAEIRELHRLVNLHSAGYIRIVER
jgi:hypothetical protein